MSIHGPDCLARSAEAHEIEMGRIPIAFEVSDRFDPEAEEGPAQPDPLYRITTVHAGTPTQDEVASR